MKNVLFICSQNKLRSPTAEAIFANHPGIECMSAGTNHDAINPLTPEWVQWADLIFVMERSHREKLQSKYKKHLSKARVICLDIPDNYAFMDPILVRILENKVTKFLPHIVTTDPAA